MTRRKKRLLVLHASTQRHASFYLYLYGYPRAFARTEVFDAAVVNVVTSNPVMERLGRWRAVLGGTYDAVVLLHSIFSSSLALPPRWRDTVKRLGAPVVFFVGNEYYRMPAKMAFAKDMDVTLLVSQCLSERILRLYRDHLGCNVIGLPNAGFDAETFPPGPPTETRPIDIGYRMMPGWPYFGHWEREDIAAAVEQGANGHFVTDISLDPKDRFPAQQWRAFLQNCKTQLSVASGSNIFELDDSTVLKVCDFWRSNPHASREQIAALYPPRGQWTPLRTVSSRMIEAAATKTSQIMYPEEIGIPLRPDVDYIALRRDHANLDEVLVRISDTGFLEHVAANCFELFSEETSYSKIFSDLNNALGDMT